MNAKIITGIVIAVLALMSFVAAPTPSLPTVVDGHIYSGESMFTPPVQGVTVEVDCNGTKLSDETDADGYFRVVYDNVVCPLGSEVEACAGSQCDTRTLIGATTRINLLGFKLFDVPEFSMIAAGLALGGASIGYAVLRRRK